MSRRVKTLSFGLALMACTAGLSLHSVPTARAADACGDTTAGLALGTGTQTYLTSGINQATMKTDALAQVVKWRQDALADTAVKWGGMTMKQYLASHSITEATYLNPAWSRDLERIAVQRSVEATVMWDHTRPNGLDTFSLKTTTGNQSWGEVIATNGMPDAVDLWASEKSAYVQQTTGVVTGHYTFLIDPSNLAYGFGDAGPAVGETTHSLPTDQTATGWSGSCVFRVPLLPANLTTAVSPTSAVVGQAKTLAVTATPTGTVQSLNGRGAIPLSSTTMVLRGTITSSNPAAATVTGTQLAAVSPGTTALTIASGDQNLQLGTFSVVAKAISSVQRPAVRTVQGTAPSLPSTVTATWNDGTTSVLPVSWDAVPATAYAQPGSFSVAGRATLPTGGTTAATANVTVELKGFTPVTGSLPAADGLLGEATGDGLADVWALDPHGTIDFHRYTSAGLVKVGVRAQNMTDVSYLAPIQDQDGDGRADVLYRTTSDGALWFAYSQGNGYLKQGIQVGAHWNGMDQIFYAGQMVPGSAAQFVLARRASDGTLWRYDLSSSGLSNGTQVGRGFGNMRVMVSAGSMWGDKAWDVVTVSNDGNMYGFVTTGGRLSGVGEVGHGWSSMTTAFVPGDLTGDGRLDLMGQRSDGSVWGYANTGTGWSGLGQKASGFGYVALG